MAPSGSRERQFDGGNHRFRHPNLDGFSDYAEIVPFAKRLLERGFTDEDVHKILGENYLRVAEALWPSGPLA